MSLREHRSLILLAIAGVGSVAAFVVPWYLPASGSPVLSDSYVLGFTNWAASLLLLASAGALALVASLLPAPPFGEPLWTTGRDPSRKRALLAASGLTILSLLILGVLAGSTRGVPYGEERYFLDLMAQVAAGHRPLVDFPYSYSFAALYVPVWLWQALKGTGLTPSSAYLIVYVAFVIISYVLFYAVVTRLKLSDGRRAAIILCIGIPTTLTCMLGIQTLPARYLAPVAALLALHYWGGSGRLGRRWSWPALVAIALGGSAFTAVLASTEMVIALGIATVAYLLLLARREQRQALIAAAVYVGCLAAVAVAGQASLDLVGSFAGGAANFPVLPGPPAILYFAAVIAVAVLLPRALRSPERAEHPLTLSLAVLSAVLVPAALGRADAAHLLGNGLVLFILAATLLAHAGRRAFTAYLLIFVVVFSVAQYVALTQFSRTQILRAAASSTSLSDAGFAQFEHVLTWPPTAAPTRDRASYVWPRAETSTAVLSPYASIAAPFGLYPPDSTLPFTFAEQHRLAPDPFTGPGLTTDDLAKKLVSLKSADCLLVPREYAAAVEAAVPGQTPAEAWALAPHQQKTLWALTLFPLGFYERNPQPNLSGLLLAGIKKDFKRAGTWGPYAVYERR